MYELRYYWLEIAKGLAVGSKVRVSNPLNPNSRNSLDIYNSIDSYSCWDFRHNKGDRVEKEFIFETEVLDYSKPIPLPNNIPYDLLEPYQKQYVDRFLVSKGITPHMLNKLNKQLLYASKVGRLLVECKTLDSSYFIGRDLSGKSSAKWLSYREHPKQCYDINLTSNYDKLILTEDSLSALKVSFATGLTTLALSGTMLKDEVALICSDYSQAIVWLDGDEAGQNGTTKVVKDLRSITDVSSINVQGKDPKDLTIQEIRTWLKM